MPDRVSAHRRERQFGRQVPPFGPVDGRKIQRVPESVVLAEVQRRLVGREPRASVELGRPIGIGDQGGASNPSSLQK